MGFERDLTRFRAPPFRFADPSQKRPFLRGDSGVPKYLIFVGQGPRRLCVTENSHLFGQKYGGGCTFREGGLMADFSAAGAVGSLALGAVGWVGLNLFGKPILALRDKRREALEVAERYAYVGLRTAPSEEYQKRAVAALSDVGNSLRAYARESSLGTKLYCWVLRYDLGFAARAALWLGRAVQAAGGQYRIVEIDKMRRPTLHVLFVALGATHHLSAGEVAAARMEMKQWHSGNRELTTSGSMADNA